MRAIQEGDPCHDGHDQHSDRCLPVDHRLRERLAPHYSALDWPSIAPELLIKAMLIGYLFGITSECRLMREIQVNLSYLRFLGLDLEAEVWHPTTYAKNRNQRFQESEIVRWLFDHVVAVAVAGAVKAHHVSQDSTLVRANCSFKSFESIEVRQSPKHYRKRVARENPVPKDDLPRPQAIGSIVGHCAYAFIYSQQKKLDLARSEYVDAIHEQPNSAKAHSYFGQYLANVERRAIPFGAPALFMGPRKSVRLARGNERIHERHAHQQQ